MPFVLAILLGATIACVVAVAVGLGALRVKGLLLAISTMAFAIAAEQYIFPRPIFAGTEGALNVDLHAGQARPVRPRAPQPRVLLLRAGAARRSCWSSSATSGAPASAA